MYQLVLALLLCWLTVPVLAQQPLARARQRSYLTEIFRLTDAQTRRLFERGLLAARPDFFRVPVGSFPTDSVGAGARRLLPLGYYLVAHTEGPRLVYWLRVETSRQVEVIDNQQDLVLAVRDSLGHLLPGAQVRLRRRPVPYDAATRSYRLAGAGRAGLVAVDQGGRRTYHVLGQAYPTAYQRGHWPRRAANRLLYGWPLGYLSNPVRRTARKLAHASQVYTGPIGLLRAAFSEDARGATSAPTAATRATGATCC